MPARAGPVLPCAGYAMLAAAYLAIGVALLGGRPGDGLLVALLALGGFGLGTGFATMIGHLTNAVPPGYAPDVSGVSTTTLVIGGAVGVAAFGSLYFALASQPGEVHARHAFDVTSLVLAAAAVVATVAAYLATHVHAEHGTAPRPTSATAAR